MRQGMLNQTQLSASHQNIQQQQQQMHSTSQQNINPNNQSVTYHQQQIPKKPQFYPPMQSGNPQNTSNNITNTSYMAISEKPPHRSNQQKPMHHFQNPHQVNLKSSHIEASGKSGHPRATSSNNHHNQQPLMNHKQQQQQQQYGAAASAQQTSNQLQMNSISVNPSNHYKFQTPTHQSQTNQMMNQKQSQQVMLKEKFKRKKNKKYQLIIQVIEANLIVSKTKFFQMSVHVKLKMNDIEEKTSSQSGQCPKWNETFIFDNIQRKSQIEFSVYHKSLFAGEELIGNAIFIFQDLYSYNLKKFITLYDKGAPVGSLNINLNVVKEKSESKDADASISKSLDGENDIDEDLVNSIDYRDHEISRQIVSNKNSRNRQHAGMTVDDLGSRKNEYKALQTMQQMQSSSIYLNTQVNQPRQSVTENSIIQHYSNTHSSADNSLDKINDSPGLNSKDINTRANRHRHHHHHHHKHHNQGEQKSRNKKQQQLLPLNGSIEDEQIIPQQLFYGKNGQHHSNSSNNLLMINQSQHQQVAPKYQQHSNSQFLYLDDFQPNIGAQQKRSHNKSKKDKSSKRKDKYQQQQQQVQQHQQQPLIQVDQFLDDMVDQHDVIECDEEVNYGNYLNQRSGNHFGGTAISGVIGTGSGNQNQISTSQSQQLLSALNKHPIGFDSGGGTSNSGGVHPQFYNNIGAGSNGSQYPMGPVGGVGPSYFEEQNSIESLNEAVVMQGPQSHQQNFMQGMLPYDISEFQGIEQIRMDLREENDRIKTQEARLRMAFEKYQIELQNLYKEKHEIRKLKEQLRYDNNRISAQKEEYDYQRQQMERAYVNLKKDKLKFSQQVMIIEELNRLYNEQIKEMRILQNAKAHGQVSNDKIEEFLTFMKGIHYMIQQLVSSSQNHSSNSNQRINSRLEETKQVAGAHNLAGSGNSNGVMSQNILGHLQQESTSSCATNSTGNYNFIMQGSTLFHHKGGISNHSPIHANNKNLFQANLPQSSKNQTHQQLHQQQQIQSLSTSNSRTGLLVGGNHQQHPLQDSISPPKVITDIINSEEDDIIESLEQELFKRMSPRSNDVLGLDHSEYDSGNQLKYKSNNPLTVVKQGDNSNQMMNGGQKGRGGIAAGQHFLNEQHELSTIIERELTSQRRSSNGGMGPNTTMEGRLAANNGINNGPGNALGVNSGAQFMPQASAFQMMSGDNSNNTLDEDDESIKQNLFITQQQNQQQHHQQQAVRKSNKGDKTKQKVDNTTNQAFDQQMEVFSQEKRLLDEEKREYEERKQQLEGLYQKLYKELEDIQVLKQGMLQNIGQQQQQQHPNTNNIINQQSINNVIVQHEVEAENNGIVHITASDMKNSNTMSQLGGHGFPTTNNVTGFQPNHNQFNQQEISRSQQQQQQQIISHFQQDDQQQQQQQQELQEEESFHFEPNPDFLKMINQNMCQNDGKFNGKGQINRNNNNNTDHQQVNQQLNNNFGGMMFQNHQQQQQQQQHQQYMFEQYYSQDEEDDEYGDQNNHEYGDEHQQQQMNEIMSQGEHGDYLMMISAAGIAAASGIPTNNFLDDNDEPPLPGQSMLGGESNAINTSAIQGQGDRKIEYIQDEFEDIDVLGEHHEPQQQQYQEQIQMIGPNGEFEADDGHGHQYNDYGNEDGEGTFENYGTIKRDNSSSHAQLNLQSDQMNQNSSSNQNSNSASNQKDPSSTQKQHSTATIKQPIQLLIKGKTEKLTDEEIQKLIDENYLYDDCKDSSVIYYNGKIYDEKKRAVYGIQRRDNHF